MTQPTLLFLVIDGAADDPTSRPTPLEKARTPGLDELAKHAICGLMYPIAPGIAPESDTAVLSILGYNPERYYTGRGPLEALGAGLEFVEGKEVAFRANFATIDERTLTIIDRRVGRSLSSSEAQELAKALDGMELSGGGYVKVKATVGHRAVVIIGSKRSRLSAEVSNTDPAYERRGLISIATPRPSRTIAECRPLSDDPAAYETARLVNEFTRKVVEILSKHPVNLDRERRGLLKANAILLRDAGDKLPRLPPISELYGGKRFGAIVEMPVERGIALAAGMKMYDVGYPTGQPERDLKVRLEATLRALKENDVVYVHLKGPDEPGHDGSFEGKVRAIELIDEHFVRPLIEAIDLDKTAILVTSDHATPWRAKSHTDHPVPVMLSWKRIGRGLPKFCEAACMHAAGQGLGVVEHGWELLKKVFAVLSELT